MWVSLIYVVPEVPGRGREEGEHSYNGVSTTTSTEMTTTSESKKDVVLKREN